MNGALMQDQWEAMLWACMEYVDFPALDNSMEEVMAMGYVPVPPVIIENWVGVDMIEQREAE